MTPVTGNGQTQRSERVRAQEQSEE
jgi:hypothetical protein